MGRQFIHAELEGTNDRHRYQGMRRGVLLLLWLLVVNVLLKKLEILHKGFYDKSYLKIFKAGRDKLAIIRISLISA